MTGFSRRDFTKQTIARDFSQLLPQGVKIAPTVGIQVESVFFLGEGIGAVLDRFRQNADSTAPFMATFSYARGIEGRRVLGRPLPERGKHEYDTEYNGVKFRHHSAALIRAPLRDIRS
jgi:hypothetical protein